MQLVPEEVSACSSSMAVINSEEGAPWPLIDLFEFRLDDVQDDRNSILIVIPDDSLMCVGRVAADDPVLLASELGRMIRLNIPLDLLLLHLHVFLLLLDSHDEATVSDQLVLALRLLHIGVPLATGGGLLDLLMVLSRRL